MKFYQTTNASVTYRFGGFEFQFEPVEVLGGAWRGVLATDNVKAQSAIDGLIKSGSPIFQVETLEEFEQLKKKVLQAVGRSSRNSREPSLPQPARPTAKPAEEPQQDSEDTQSSTGIEAITIAEVDPPDDLPVIKEKKRRK